MKELQIVFLFLMTLLAGTAFGKEQYETDIIPTGSGDLTITFLGHGSLIFSFDGMTIAIDPYSKVADYTTLPKADLILITHEHGDHLDLGAIKAIRSDRTAVAANPAAANTAAPTFIADVHGTYVAQLVVSDPWVVSQPATVTISFENLKPVANAGTNLSVPVGVVAFLDGSGSRDANGDPLTYRWSLTAVPS